MSVPGSGRTARAVALTVVALTAVGVLNIRRTAIHRLAGSSLVEESHTDAPYTP